MSYAVLLEGDAALRPADLARALAAVRKVPVLDLMGPMRHCWGIVEEGVTKAAAEETARILGAAGLGALAVPAELLEDLPPSEPATRLAFSAGDLAYAEREAPERRAGWKRLSLIAAAAFSETTAAAAAAGDPAEAAKKLIKTGITLMTGLPTSLGLSPKPVELRKEVVEQVCVVDLLLKDPPERLRIEGGRFDFSCLGARKGYNVLANVKVLVGLLAAAAPAAALSRGAQVILEGRPLREMGYDGLADLEREQRWRLTLAALKPR